MNYEINLLSQIKLNINDIKAKFEKQKKYDQEENAFTSMSLKFLNEDIQSLKIEITETESFLKRFELKKNLKISS